MTLFRFQKMTAKLKAENIRQHHVRARLRREAINELPPDLRRAAMVIDRGAPNGPILYPQHSRPISNYRERYSQYIKEKRKALAEQFQ